jgi:hypothetical protein
VDDDGGGYANKYLLFKVDAADYSGKKVLAVPRCCQTRKGSTNRARVNEGVMLREGKGTWVSELKDGKKLARFVKIG